VTIYKLHGYQDVLIQERRADPKYERERSEIFLLIGGYVLVVDKETIIFFEQLGFGWVLDNMTLKEIKLNKMRDDLVTDASLIKIIENMLADNPNI
jgi:hypothetical protein